MKKYPIILLVLVSIFSCTKEESIEITAEKVNFNETYLSNLKETKDIIPYVQQRIFNVLQNEVNPAEFDEDKFAHLFQKTNRTEKEEVEFLELLKMIGFHSLENFYQYNQAIANLKSNLETFTNFEEKNQEELEEIFKVVFMKQLALPKHSESGYRDQCFLDYQDCVRAAKDFTANCVALCAAGGVFWGVVTLGSGAPAAFALSAVCMAGCVASENIEIAACRNAYDTCRLNNPLPPGEVDPVTGVIN